MKEVIKYKTKSNKKNKRRLYSRNILLILGIIYTLITILALVSYVSKINSMSTTPITIGSVIEDISWQLIMIALFAITYIVYAKKPVLGVLLEIIMGMAMLVYIVISVAIMGINFLALLIELIYPLILISHGLIEFKKLNKKKKTKRSTI